MQIKEKKNEKKINDYRKKTFMNNVIFKKYIFYLVIISKLGIIYCDDDKNKETKKLILLLFLILFFIIIIVLLIIIIVKCISNINIISIKLHPIYRIGYYYYYISLFCFFPMIDKFFKKILIINCFFKMNLIT